MKKRKLKGFYLAIAVDRFDYADGNLRVKVKIGVFTYPDKSLLGNVDKTLTAQGRLERRQAVRGPGCWSWRPGSPASSSPRTRVRSYESTRLR